ncbi:MAG TPA: septum formation initiator family protein [Candidatus Saccharimonadales bacterium]|nr:septum formation initiator family protein [Candidatus Saccharimonadales bacterium]
MPNFSFRQLRKNLTLNNLVVAVALLIAASWAWGTVNTLQKNFSLQQELDNLKQENSNLKLRNQTLVYRQDYYKSNEYLELAARSLLGKAQPGERLVVLPQASVKSTSERPTAPVRRPTNFSQWMMFLFGEKHGDA